MQPKKLEIKRKLFHMIAGLILVILIDLDIINILVITIILILSIVVSILAKKIKVPILYWFLKHMDRKEDLEKSPGKGAVNFLAGSLLALILFDKNLAIASILILTIGDAVSSLVGIHFGKTVNPINNKKLLEGTIAGIIISFLFALIFINYKEALIAATIGMVIEAIELKVHKEFIINDNIAIPLASGLAVTLFRLIF